MKAQFRIEDVFIITGRGVVVTGRLVGPNRSFSTGDIVTIGDKNYTIKGIEESKKTFGDLPGDNIGILINGDKEEIKRYLKDICDIRSISELRDDRINDILDNNK